MNIIWQAIAAWGNPDPLAAHLGSTAAVLDIGVLVFREGLECILVLAAVTAGMAGGRAASHRPIAAGAGAAFICTLITWRAAVGVIDDLTAKVSALALQAATGLAAILVLLVVMNWFFHEVYWAGWISMHTRKKRALMQEEQACSREGSLWFGLALCPQRSA